MQKKTVAGRANSSLNPRLNFYDQKPQEKKYSIFVGQPKPEARSLKRKLDKMMPANR